MNGSERSGGGSNSMGNPGPGGLRCREEEYLEWEVRSESLDGGAPW